MFPEYLEEKSIVKDEDKITIYFNSKRKACECPSCNTISSTVSTYFQRNIQDLNIIEKSLHLVIKLAKYRCENPDCSTKVFSENINELAETKARRTNRLNELLTKFALLESAESVSRKCRDINIIISGDTLLRLSKKWEPNIDLSKIESIEIDDFALKKT